VIFFSNIFELYGVDTQVWDLQIEGQLYSLDAQPTNSTVAAADSEGNQVQDTCPFSWVLSVSALSGQLDYSG
jgi:hypothetical protein